MLVRISDISCMRVTAHTEVHGLVCPRSRRCQSDNRFSAGRKIRPEFASLGADTPRKDACPNLGLLMYTKRTVA